MKKKMEDSREQHGQDKNSIDITLKTKRNYKKDHKFRKNIN